MQIRKQFRETCKTQTKQYKRYKAQILQTTPKEQQKEVIKQLKEEKHRKLTLLGEQVSLVHLPNKLLRNINKNNLNIHVFFSSFFYSMNKVSLICSKVKVIN